MPMNPIAKWALRVAIIPAAVITYVTVAGLTGFCPSCKAVVDGVLGRHEPLARPTGVAENISGLKGYTLDGQPVELASFAGKPMIVEVWATWCGPCRTQRGIMHDLAPELKDKVTVVALSVDTKPSLVEDFLKNNPSDMVELMAPSETLAAFGNVRAVPTLVFVDAKGTIRGVEAGIHSASLLRERISELGAETN